MKQYGVNELRRMFLEFFEGKGHLVMKSFSLVPHNDKSLLLINSGMAPLKPYFTGAEIPPRRRVATCQKCIRTGDIENVGKTSRHGTFFEMLGNFSFGDYFKHEAIEWSWEFLTRVVGLDADRLYPSVYEEDDEAFEIWNKEIGIDAERIFKFGKEDNFWEHGEGPCGPCSEIYYDRGEKYGCSRPGCTVGCDCDRYVEVWNNVFSQFNGDGKGGYTELKQKNIDTGMGLERLAMIVQDVDSIFDIDTVRALRDRVCESARVAYGTDAKKDVSIRLITDHMRSATFMISDGIMPSNEARGYVLRRLIRRAARHAALLGIKSGSLSKLAETVIELSKDGYPELEEKKDFILHVLSKEEAKFDRTIDQGLRLLLDLKERTKETGAAKVSGDDAFRLYDTYGFPLDLTREILAEDHIAVDEAGFKKKMDEQRDLARKARKTTNYMGADATVFDKIGADVTCTFKGYDVTACDSVISVITAGDDLAEAVTEGEEAALIADETPFYATMGGQEGDKGLITAKEGEFVVRDTVRLLGGKIAHLGVVTEGMLKKGDMITLAVDKENRIATCRNHSATHLLHGALRQVLGTHVEQKGSYVSADRLRFDFSHFEPVSSAELEQVEKIVNAGIRAHIEVTTEVTDLKSAKESGAMALFDEKYGESVRVVTMGDRSKELCGGTHVSNTGDIICFKILSESGVAAGVRRIEAVTGDGVFTYYKNAEKMLLDAADVAKVRPSELAEKVAHMTTEIRKLENELESLRSSAAKDALTDSIKNAADIEGVKLITASVDDADMNTLRKLSDTLKEKQGALVAVLASRVDDKVNLIVTATDEAVKRGADSAKMIKTLAPLIGGGGGGRETMAQAGGKNPSGIKAALSEAEKALSLMIN